MSWRASPFFDQQFDAIAATGDADIQAFRSEVLSSSADDPLLIFADWLEERGDPRADYIRDMCALAVVSRPLDPLVDRVNVFEAELNAAPLACAHAVGNCLVLSTARKKYLSKREVDAFKECLQTALTTANGIRRMILDLDGTEFIGSALLATFITVHRQAKTQQCEFHLCRVRPAIREVFLITRLDQLFKIHETVDAAVPE